MSETDPVPAPEPSAGPGRIMVAGLAGVALLIVVLLIVAPKDWRSNQRVTGKDPAPAVTFYDQSGGKVSLADYHGKIVLLNFWASWCPPCVEEMPDLERLARRMAGRDDFVVLGASQDDTWGDLQAAAQKFGVTFPVVHDPNGEGARAFGTVKIPETYLIDRDGKIIQKWIGYQSWSHDGFVQRFNTVLDAQNGQTS